ncbi:unnamed protein product [Choristocarpus tenellus]
MCQRILPLHAVVCVAGVELPELCLSHGPVGRVSGFDHGPFNARVKDVWHTHLYPYPLWMYKHSLVTPAMDLLRMDYSSLPEDIEAEISLPITADGTCHAILIWVDYQLDEISRVTTYMHQGATGSGTNGGGRGRYENGDCKGRGDGDGEKEDCVDDVSTESLSCTGRHFKQAIKFLPNPQPVSTGGMYSLTVRGKFDCSGGQIVFDTCVAVL